MMECNHHDRDYLTPESSKGIFCRYCQIQLSKEIIPCKDGYKGTMQMLEGQDYLLESFERNFYYYKFVTYEKGEEMKEQEKVKPLSKSDEDHFKLISEVNQAIKKSEDIDQSNIKDNGYIGLPEIKELNQNSGINQHVIINNQINKITDLETEVKRLQKIVIGLSERLINLK